MATKDCSCAKKKGGTTRRPFLMPTQDNSVVENERRNENKYADQPPPQPDIAQSQTCPNFVPLPYSFRTPDVSTDGACMTVRAPPFWLQVDHALAVLWCLFSPEQAHRPLGITQLQWTLEFLKGIRSRCGDYPEDVQVCIQAIQDRLIEQYAGMRQVIGQTDSNCGMTTCEPCNLPSMSPEVNAELKTENASEDKSTKERSQYRPLATSSRIEMQPIASFPTFIDDKSEYIHTCPKAIPHPEAAPISITYESMIQHGPSVPNGVFNAQQFGQNPVEALTNSDLSTAVRNALPPGGAISKDDILGVLKQFRSDQVGRIQNELKKLHSIEKYMSNVDKDSFEPLMEEHVVKRLQDIEKGPNASYM